MSALMNVGMCTCIGLCVPLVAVALNKSRWWWFGFFSRENHVQIIQVHMFSVLQEFDLGERGLQEHVDIKLEALMPRVGSVESFHCCKLLHFYTCKEVSQKCSSKIFLWVFAECIYLE